MLDINLPNVITVGLISIVTMFAFHWLAAMMGWDVSWLK